MKRQVNSTCLFCLSLKGGDENWKSGLEVITSKYQDMLMQSKENRNL